MGETHEPLILSQLGFGLLGSAGQEGLGSVMGAVAEVVPSMLDHEGVPTVDFSFQETDDEHLLKG